MAKTFCVCSCFFTHNVFLQRYGLHCVFLDDDQFGEDYRAVSELTAVANVKHFVLC